MKSSSIVIALITEGGKNNQENKASHRMTDTRRGQTAGLFMVGLVREGSETKRSDKFNITDRLIGGKGGCAVQSQHSQRDAHDDVARLLDANGAALGGASQLHAGAAGGEASLTSDLRWSLAMPRTGMK